MDLSIIGDRQFKIGIGVLSLFFALIGSWAALTGWTAVGLGPQVFGPLSFGFLLLGLTVLLFQILDKTQQYYLDLIDRESEMLRMYRMLLDEDAWRSETEGDTLTYSNPAKILDMKGLSHRRMEAITSIEIALRRLEKAEQAVYRGDFTTFLSEYYFSNRTKIDIYYLLDFVESYYSKEFSESYKDESSRIESLARWVLYVSRKFPEGDSDRDQIEEYLLENPSLKSNLSPYAVHRAVTIIQGRDLTNVANLTDIRDFIRKVIPSLIIVIPLYIWGLTNGVLGVALDGENPIVTSWWFVILIAVTGIFGALFLMGVLARDSTQNLTSYPSVPDPTVMKEMIVLRVLIGASAALVLYTLLMSSFGAEFLTDTIRMNKPALLVIAFVAGFSERLVPSALEQIESKFGG